MGIWVILFEPANGAARPQAVEAFGAWDVCALVEGAIAGKNTIGCQNFRHLRKGGAFVRDEVDRVAEKSRVGILDKGGEVFGLPLNKIGLSLQSHFVHAGAGVA